MVTQIREYTIISLATACNTSILIRIGFVLACNISIRGITNISASKEAADSELSDPAEGDYRSAQKSIKQRSDLAEIKSTHISEIAMILCLRADEIFEQIFTDTRLSSLMQR